MQQGINNYETELARRILHPHQLSIWREGLRKKGLTLASLNGSFDLLHSGHLHMLYEASLQADLLLVGLNSDASVQKYKHPSRPILALKDRLAMVASLRMVDYVSYFEESDPIDWLKLVEPEVHINGAEYGPDCIEADLLRKMGARLHLVERIPGLATTLLIQRIQAL